MAQGNGYALEVRRVTLNDMDAAELADVLESIVDAVYPDGQANMAPPAEALAKIHDTLLSWGLDPKAPDECVVKHIESRVRRDWLETRGEEKP